MQYMVCRWSKREGDVCNDLNGQLGSQRQKGTGQKLSLLHSEKCSVELSRRAQRCAGAAREDGLARVRQRGTLKLEERERETGTGLTREAGAGGAHLPRPRPFLAGLTTWSGGSGRAEGGSGWLRAWQTRGRRGGTTAGGDSSSSPSSSAANWRRPVGIRPAGGGPIDARRGFAAPGDERQKRRAAMNKGRGSGGHAAANVCGRVQRCQFRDV